MRLEQIGPYRLESLLGVGGMGEVYRAYDTRRDRVVALKVLPEALSKDDEYLRRFRRESHVAARLREPHVIPIHDYGEVDGRLFIDMRLVDGQNVRDLLSAGGAMPPARAVEIVRQVAEALDAAHADGLVHRDIKPSNVLVTASGFVYVVDFGIARSIGDARTALTITGVTVGTLDYMAPERFTNQQIDGRTDVYSLACLLHECLTGEQPFPGEDLPSLMYAHLYSPIPEPSQKSATVPAAFDAVIAQGMAKSAEDRYPTATALARAAGAALESPALRVEGTRTPSVAVPAPAAAPERMPAPASPHHPGRPGPPGPPSHPAPTGAESVASGSSAPRQALDRPVPGPVPQASVQHGRPPPGGPPPSGPPPAGAPGSAGGAGMRRGRLALITTLVAVSLLLVAVAAVVVIAVRTEPGPAGGIANSGIGTAAPVETAQIATSIAVPTVKGTIPANPTPGYLEVAPNGRFAYICNRDTGVVTVLDTTIDKVTATIPVPAGPPQFVSFAPNGKRAYISIYNTDRTVNLVGVLDTATNMLVTTIPVGRRPFASATNPDGSLLYVPSHDEGLLDVVDITTETVTAKINVAPNPHWVVFSRDGTRIYTANHESNVVSVLDAATNAILTTIPVGTSPHSTALSPDGTRLAVVNFESDNVSVVDTASNAVVATVAVGQRPQDITFTPDGRYMYTANVDGDNVSVIDTATNSVTATIPVGSGPTSVGMRLDGREAYVTNLNDGTITILNTSGS